MGKINNPNAAQEKRMDLRGMSMSLEDIQELKISMAGFRADVLKMVAKMAREQGLKCFK